MIITTRPASKFDTPTFCKLWQFYEYDKSYFSEADLNGMGEFGVDEKHLDDMIQGRTESQVHLAFVNGVIAGFAVTEPTDIVNTTMPALAELLVLPKYRNLGVASYIIDTLMLSKEGQWHVAVQEKDQEALDFWQYKAVTMPIKALKRLQEPSSPDLAEYIITNQDKP